MFKNVLRSLRGDYFQFEFSSCLSLFSFHYGEINRVGFAGVNITALVLEATHPTVFLDESIGQWFIVLYLSSW